MNICMSPSCENKRDISLNMNTHSFRCPKKVLSAAIVFALHRSDLYVFFPFFGYVATPLRSCDAQHPGLAASKKNSQPSPQQLNWWWPARKASHVVAPWFLLKQTSRSLSSTRLLQNGWFFSNADKSMRNEWEGLCKARPGCPSPTVLNPNASKK